MLMRWALLLALSLPALLPAEVYYANKGTKYHIGDGRFGRSVESEFLDAYPVVGEQWVQAFTVSAPDVVRVRIDHVWAVDDCAYCKDMIFIDDHPMGRFAEEDNNKPFITPSPLSMRVVPGHVYVLKIVTIGLNGQMDDYAIEGISIESDKAALHYLEPGPLMLRADAPMPHFSAPAKVAGPCEGTQAVDAWLPASARQRGVLEFLPQAQASSRRTAADLQPGQFLRIFVKVDEAMDGDAVSQFLEVLLGEPASGWVLSFPPKGKSPLAGNMKREGRYEAAAFDTSHWNADKWNELRLAICEGGVGRLWLNGKDLGQTVQHLNASQTVRLRASGLKAVLSEKAY